MTVESALSRGVECVESMPCGDDMSESTCMLPKVRAGESSKVKGEPMDEGVRVWGDWSYEVVVVVCTSSS
jgi:hypothetical protein